MNESHREGFQLDTVDANDSGRVFQPLGVEAISRQNDVDVPSLRHHKK
jgi:hypothetical protein